MSLYHIDETGGIAREHEIVEDDLQSGHLVWRDDEDGSLFSVDSEGDLFELDDELADYDLSVLDELDHQDGEPDLSKLSPMEATLYQTFREASNTPAEAIEQFVSYVEQFEATHGADEEDGEEELYDFLRDKPAGLIGDPEFQAIFERVESLPDAYRIWERGRDLVAEAKSDLGGPQRIKTFDDAFAAWDAEKAAVDAEKPRGYVETPRGYGSDLDTAVDDFVGNDLAATNDAKRAARLRAQIEMQESRGR